MSDAVTAATAAEISAALKLKHQIIRNIHINKELRELDCSNCKLDNLPDKLPKKLRILNCYNNDLTEIRKFPANVRILRCYDNKITILTFPKHSKLFAINCSYNNILHLGNLPSKLKDFVCCDNHLTTLPNLPSTLLYLNCNFNCISELPALPAALHTLKCHGNFLHALPDVLPHTLTRLECSTNNLTHLPDLSNTQINLLHCTANLITELPGLPATLKELSCFSNQITKLPEELPSGLRVLLCYNNKLSELPDLPESMRYILSYSNSDAFHAKYPKLVDMEDELPFNDWVPTDDWEDETSYSHIRAIINYVNGINSRDRIRARLYVLHPQGNPFLEPYMRRKMHPDNLKPLRDDETIDVSEYMEQYVDSL